MSHIKSKQIIYSQNPSLIKPGSSGKAFANKRFNVINLCCCGNIILISSQVTCAGVLCEDELSACALHCVNFLMMESCHKWSQQSCLDGLHVTTLIAICRSMFCFPCWIQTRTCFQKDHLILFSEDFPFIFSPSPALMWLTLSFLAQGLKESVISAMQYITPASEMSSTLMLSRYNQHQWSWLAMCT